MPRCQRYLKTIIIIINSLTLASKFRQSKAVDYRRLNDGQDHFISSLTFLKNHEYVFIHLYKNIDLIVCLISRFSS